MVIGLDNIINHIMKKNGVMIFNIWFKTSLKFYIGLVYRDDKSST